MSTAISLDSGLTTLRGAAVSPSGRLVVTYGVNVLVFTVTIWDVAAQQPIRQLETSRAPMTVSFTPDEVSIVGAFLSPEDGSAEVIRWPVTGTGTGPGEVLHTESGIAGVTMARDTGTVIFRSATGSVTVLNTATGLAQPVGPRAEFQQVAVSSRGTLIALATGRDIQVATMPADGSTGGVSTPVASASGSVQAMDCTENAVFAAAGTTVSAVYGDRQGAVFTGPGPVREMALSTAGDMLAVAQGGRVDLLDLRTTATIDQIDSGSPVARLTFSLEDGFLITAHEDSTARLWDLTSAREARSSTPGSAPGPGHGSGAPARFSRLSASSLRVLEYADGLRRALDRDEVHLDHLLAGVAQGGRSAEQLLDRAGISRAVLVGAMGLTSLPSVTPGTLESAPPLSRHAGEALDRALRFADNAGSAVIRSQDLLRGALSVTDCTMVQELGQRGITLAALDAADVPPAVRAPLLAGAAADTVPEPGEGRVREADRLGVAAEVEMLVSILMASDTPLPLAVGLFGDWGSGKSFFMALMQERIDELAWLSSQGRPEAGPFCEQVRQVRFNAWHYVDTNLWASLAATLFDELARPRSKDGTEARQDEAKLAQLDEARQQAAAARQHRQNLEQEVRAQAAAAARPAVVAKSAVSVAIHAVRGPEIRDRLKAARGSSDEDAPVQVESIPDADIDRLISTLGEIDGVAANTQVGWRLFTEELLDGERRRPTVIALAVLLALATVAAVVLNSPAVIKVLAFIGAVLLGLAPALSGAVRVLYLVREARDARELPLVRKREELDQARAQERSAEQEVALREEELARLRDKGLQLQEFIRERATSADYRGRLGVISQVRRDFEQLVALVPGQPPPSTGQAGAAQVAAVAHAVAERVPEVQRIILYVDDLDRCPSEKVVEVLQAVHLLLAFKLFVVVVGVDSRWLEKSLKAHYRRLLEDPGSYLEKIFQIPFILQRMTPARYRDLIEGLTPQVAPRLPGVRAAAGDAAPEVPAAPATPDVRGVSTSPVSSGRPASPVRAARPQDAGVAAPPEAATGTGPAEQPPPALPRPEALVISAGERVLLGHLGGIVPTPRAAKRLVNIYRMLRVSVPDGELDAFGPDGGGEYQAVILLLALLVGQPAEAGGVFTALRAASNNADIWQVLDGCGATAAVTALREHITLSSAGPYRRWAPRVARFSFRLGTVPPGDQW